MRFALGWGPTGTGGLTANTSQKITLIRVTGGCRPIDHPGPSDVPRGTALQCVAEPVGFGMRHLVPFQDRLTVEPDRDPGAGALDLDSVPLGSRPPRVGSRALVPIILQSSLDAWASALSPAMSGQPGPMPKGGIPVYPLRRVDLIRVGPASGLSQVDIGQVPPPAPPHWSGPNAMASSRRSPARRSNGRFPLPSLRSG
jgi:hypothetical protein